MAAVEPEELMARCLCAPPAASGGRALAEELAATQKALACKALQQRCCKGQAQGPPARRRHTAKLWSVGLAASEKTSWCRTCCMLRRQSRLQQGAQCVQFCSQLRGQIRTQAWAHREGEGYKHDSTIRFN